MTLLALRILHWLGTKAILIALIVAVLTSAAFIGNWLKANRITGDHVATLQGEATRLREAVNRGEGAVAAAQRALDEVAGERPHWLWEPIRRVRWQLRYEAARAAYRAAAAELADLREGLFIAVVALQRARAQISPAYAGLIHAFRQTRSLIFLVVLLALVGPPLWKLLWYFVIAPLAVRAAPVRLVDPDGVAGGAIRIGISEKSAVVPLDPAESLIARMDWVQQYTPTAGKRTRFVWKWDAPLISLAAGLIEMTEWRTTRPDAADRVVLSSGFDPDLFICRIDLTDHPGLVLRPRYVVAVTDGVTVRTRWSLLSLHSWIAGTLRYILFCGSGSVLIYGYGGIRPIDPDEGCRIEESLVLGFEGAVDFSTARTETFWPYFRGKTPLFDYRFDGAGRVLSQQALPDALRGAANPFRRAVDAVLGGLGKLIGL
jgi:hypothetical protein